MAGSKGRGEPVESTAETWHFARDPRHRVDAPGRAVRFDAISALESWVVGNLGRTYTVRTGPQTPDLLLADVCRDPADVSALGDLAQAVARYRLSSARA